MPQLGLQPSKSSAGRPLLNVLTGVPDDRLCEISVDASNGALLINMPGTPHILPYITRTFAVNMQNLEESRPIELTRLNSGPILNHIADPDRCRRALEKAEQIVQNSGRGCFNHPTSVLKTSRDSVARVLAGIDGLRMPRTFRHAFAHADALEAAIAREGMMYPVLVRVAGDHGGVSTIKVNDARNVRQVDNLNARGRTLYVTEFTDFVSPDGCYRKFRVAMIGEKIFLRHMIIGDQWLLHAERRAKNTAAEEAGMLESFATERVPKLKSLFLEIARRLDLDYLGIDCNISDDDVVTMFEANACMNILENTQASPNMWDKPCAAIKAAVLELLAAPRLWRHPPLAVAAA